MLRCAFLSMDSTADWSIDADLAFEPRQRLGYMQYTAVDNVFVMRRPSA